MPQTLIELGGEVDAPILHLAPANGFPPPTYQPMLRPLSGYRQISLPPRALWGDQKPPISYHDWGREADDLLAALAAFDLNDVLAVGHSLGGVISMLALLKEPSRFQALIMLDPPMLPPATINMIRQAWQNDAVDQIPLVQATKRRRRFFASRQEAFERFRHKPLFADWSDEALWLYIQHGLEPRPNHSGFQLTWSIEWEAHYFATVYPEIWQILPQLNGLAPTLIVRADDDATFSEDSFQRAKSLLPAADFHVMTGQGHLFPQAAPLETAQLITSWLRSL